MNDLNMLFYRLGKLDQLAEEMDKRITALEVGYAELEAQVYGTAPEEKRAA